MSLFLKIILVLLGMAYLISPADIVPEILIPYLGWLDDGLVLWSIYYLIRHGELPWFLFKRKMKPPGFSRNTAGPAGDRQDQEDKQKKRPRSHQHQTGDTRGRPAAGSSEKPPAASRTAHEILGVASDATWEDIQKAYRQEIKKYHPDKVSHLGKEFSDLANEKFLEIQNAFDTLKRKQEQKH